MPSSTPRRQPTSAARTEAATPTRKRAFKPRMKAPERRAKILREALLAFGASGYELTSMSAIAAAADVTKSVLYHYFPSKQALYLAVLEDQVGQLRALTSNRLAADGELIDRLISATDAYLEFAEQHPQTWALLFDDTTVGDADCIAGRQRISDTVVTAALTVLAADIGRAGGDATDPRMELSMEFVISGFNGAIRWWRQHPATTRAQVLETLTDLIATLGALTTKRQA